MKKILKLLPNNSSEYKIEEAQLLQGCKSGKEESLELLIKKYSGMIFQIAHKFTGNRAQTEELCQEVLVKIVKGINKFKGESRLQTWIYSVTTNHCINYRKKQKITVFHRKEIHENTSNTLLFNGEMATPVKELINKELNLSIHEAVNTLPEKLKTVILLYEFEKIPHKEIAATLQIPVGTVWSRLNKAKIILRDKLKKHL